MAAARSLRVRVPIVFVAGVEERAGVERLSSLQSHSTKHSVKNLELSLNDCEIFIMYLKANGLNGIPQASLIAWARFKQQHQAWPW
jgi:hypothetical protein